MEGEKGDKIYNPPQINGSICKWKCNWTVCLVFIVLYSQKGIDFVKDEISFMPVA